MKDWSEIKINDLFNYTIPGEWGFDLKSENGIPVLRSTNFRNDGKIDYSDIAIRDVPKTKLQYRLIKQGDILFEKSGGSTDQPAGRVVFCNINFEGTASNFIEIAKVKADYDSQFVFYLLFNLYSEGRILKYQQQTTGIINFKLNEYKKEEFVIIPLNKTEQTKIAQILSTIDKSIEQTESLIAKYTRIKNGLMQDLLTKGIDENGNIRNKKTHKFIVKNGIKVPEEWDVVELGDVVKQLKNGGTPSTKRLDFWQGKIPWITGADFLNFEVAEIRRYINENAVTSSSTNVIKKGNFLLVTRTGVGKMAIAPFDVAISQDITGVYFKDTTLVEFLLFKFQFEVDFFIKLIQGTSINGITRNDLLTFKFALPKLQEQKKIATLLCNNVNLIKTEQIKLEKFQSLKSGLMQDLLSGKVKVKNK